MSFTKLYLTNRAAPYTPATIRGAWNDTAGAVTKALDPTKVNGGLTATVARAETSTEDEYDVLLYRGVSGPLAAQEVNCNINVVIGIKSSSGNQNAHWHIYAYTTQGDSDNVRQVVIDDYREVAGVNEWPTTATFKTLNADYAAHIHPEANGDRLVFEIGLTSRNTSATSYTGTINYGLLNVDYTELIDGADAGTDVTTKAGYITFSSSIAEIALTGTIAQQIVRTASLGTPNAKVAQMSARTLSAAWAATGYIAQMSVRTLSANIPAAPSTTFPALTVAI